MNEDTQVTQIFRSLDVASIMELAAILVVAALLIVTMQRVLPWIANRLYGKRRLFVLATVPLLRLIIGVTAFLLAVPLIIEPSLQNMIALFGAVGIAVGFALKDYASSLIAGIVAIGEKPYRNGDWIRVGDVYGEVAHVGMRTVDVITPDDDRVAIPHGRLWNESISNSNDGEPRLQCVADFYLAPGHDATRAREALRDVALTSPYLHFDDPLAVIVCEKPWGTHYRLRAYPVDAAQQFRFATDLTVRGKTVLEEMGMAFATTPSMVGDAG